MIFKNKGSIVIGKNLLVNNHTRFNPVGINHQTALATMNPEAKIEIGDHCGISGVSIVSANKVTIGNYVLIGGSAAIWDTDFHPIEYEARRENLPNQIKSNPIVIEDDVFIGARSIVLKGVKIGKAAVIAAGTVVNQDVPPHHLAYGNPVQIKPLKKA